MAAAPAASASAATTPSTDLGAFKINGDCGDLSTSRRGFLLTAGPTAALPVGTTILISVEGVNDAGDFTVSGGSATVAGSGRQRSITLTASQPAGTTLTARTTLPLTASYTLTATVQIPDGYTATGAKTGASVNTLLTVCSWS